MNKYLLALTLSFSLVTTFCFRSLEARPLKELEAEFEEELSHTPFYELKDHNTEIAWCSYMFSQDQAYPCKNPDPHYSYTRVPFSKNIDAPIYSLPLQRSMAPTSDCLGFWFTVTPFTQQKASKRFSMGRFTVEAPETGILAQAGYSGSLFYARAVGTLAISKITFVDNTLKIYTENDARFGPLDGLCALGLKTDNTRAWKLNGEWFIGISAQRTDQCSVPGFVSVSSLGTGGLVNFDYTLLERAYGKYEFSALARYTYFIPRSVTLMNYTDNTILTTGSTTPGSFWDLLFALKQYYGSHHQHCIDLGYNPTFHWANQSDKTEPIEDKRKKISFYGENIPERRHTIYGTYGYNWNVSNLPMTVNVGGAATFGADVDTYGTFFATYGIGF